MRGAVARLRDNGAQIQLALRIEQHAPVKLGERHARRIDLGAARVVVGLQVGQRERAPARERARRHLVEHAHIDQRGVAAICRLQSAARLAALFLVDQRHVAFCVEQRAGDRRVQLVAEVRLERRRVEPVRVQLQCELERRRGDIAGDTERAFAIDRRLQIDRQRARQVVADLLHFQLQRRDRHFDRTRGRVVGEGRRAVFQVQRADCVVPCRPGFLRFLHGVNRGALLRLVMRTGERQQIDIAVFLARRVDRKAARIDAFDVRLACREVDALERHVPLREGDRRLLHAGRGELQRLQIQRARADLQRRRRLRPVRAEVDARSEGSV
ncbi:hypothetical protein LMG29739_03577 [Paraburkholderia solisilvae]|uniref:Uncharacterized protein n=1 Tax=Paraburkholderia solisilvae TaxID=624376 RepID=A0A6J5E401_9BURK|nr:hypothetical protein LMG29739_03577 [Paraburkholderia solisilvae]